MPCIAFFFDVAWKYGCFGKDVRNGVRRSRQRDGAAPENTRPADFSCLPRVLGPRDVLVIRKNSSELKELMVKQPKSTAPHLLVVGSPQPGMQMLMTSEAFARAREVRIPVATLIGQLWSVNFKHEKVFTVQGVYHFTAADTVESDAGDSLSCRVEYRPGKA